MKIAAITQRGSRKDFIDLYLLLNTFSLNQILQFYDSKFSDGNRFLALRSLVFFEDAEREPMPKMFLEVSWDSIKTRIVKACIALS